MTHPESQSALTAISDEHRKAMLRVCDAAASLKTGDPYWVALYDSIRAMHALLSSPEAVVNQQLTTQAGEDAKLLDWIERNLFERKWGGTLGEPSDWYVRGDYRHTTQRMRGENLRDAIRYAMKKDSTHG